MELIQRHRHLVLLLVEAAGFFEFTRAALGERSGACTCRLSDSIGMMAQADVKHQSVALTLVYPRSSFCLCKPTSS